MNYYAYGSNCDTELLREYLHSCGIGPEAVRGVRRAILHNYQIRTNYLRLSGIGAANIEWSPGDQVEGAVMDITDDVHTSLRLKEGWPLRYVESLVCLHIPRTRNRVIALTYLVHPCRRLELDLPVDSSYRESILRAATRLRFSNGYRHRLERLLRAA
jgi:hypothetical protein